MKHILMMLIVLSPFFKRHSSKNVTSEIKSADVDVKYCYRAALHQTDTKKGWLQLSVTV